jgi:four helix bundle protein
LHGYVNGTAGAPPVSVNPQAEALKQRTFGFGLEVIRFCRTLRDTWEGRELSDQLFRSGTRIGANYRAACRARSHADFVHKMGLVVEEADEAVYWLELIEASQACPSPALPPLLAEAGQLCAIFTQSHITARANANAHRAAGRVRSIGPK